MGWSRVVRGMLRHGLGTRRNARERRGRPDQEGRGFAAAVEAMEVRRLLTVTGDGFGYVADGEPFRDLDLSPGGSDVIPLLGNDVANSAPIDLGGNTFSFYGHTYTGADALYVNSSGLITLGGPSYDFSPTDLTYPYFAAIAPLWDQWSTDFGDADQVLARFQNTDADPEPDELVVEWNAAQYFYNHYWGSPSGAEVTFQAVLQLNTGDTPGDIAFNYPDLDAGDYHSDGGTSAVGIKDVGYQGGNKLLVAYYPAYYGIGADLVGTGKAIRVHWGGNDAPDADAGSAYGKTYTAPAGYPVFLDASLSTDKQQSTWTLTYEWDFDGDDVFGEYAWDGGEHGTELGIGAVFDSRGLAEGDRVDIRLKVTDGGGLSSYDDAVVLVMHNEDPVANAGPPAGGAYEVVEGRFVLLDGTQSFDPEGGLDWGKFEWDLDANNVYGEYWTPNGYETGPWTYFYPVGLAAGDSREIGLKVSDIGGASAYDTATVNVVANRPPVVDAGPWGGGDYVANSGYTYLDGWSGTYDPDEPLDYYNSFRWDLDGDGVFGETPGNGDPRNGNEVGAQPLFVSRDYQPGTLVTVSLRVTDSAGNVGEDTATILVGPNDPPTADAGPPLWYIGDYQVLAGQSLWLYGDGVDPDGYIPWENFAWDLDGDGVFGEAYWNGGTPGRGEEVGPSVLFSAAGLNGPSDYTVRLRVTDLGGKETFDDAIVHIIKIPLVSRIFGAPTSTPEGSTVTLEGAVDGRAGNDNVGLTYEWVVTRDDQPYLTGDKKILTFVPQQEGTYRATFTVTDATGEVSELTPANDLSFQISNAAPRLYDLALDSASVAQGGTVTLTGSYNDAGWEDGHSLTIDWGDGSPLQTVDLGVIGANIPVSEPRQYNGHTYYGLLGGRLSWADAEAEAVRMGGHLVAIGDAAENDFVSGMVDDVYGTGVIAWIGYNDAASEGTFVWPNGQQPTFDAWWFGEPNDYAFIPEGEDYAVTNWGGFGRWNDLPVGGTAGGRVHAAIVELDQPADTTGPTFSVTHTYNGHAGLYYVTATLTDSDGAAAVPAGPNGPVQFTGVAGANDHWYVLTDTALTFDEAEDQAVAMGGHLVSINTADEQAFIERTLITSVDGRRVMWIGFTDREFEGFWAWTSGEPVDFTNWHWGEPNNIGGGQDYGVINARYNAGDPVGLWDDDGPPNGFIRCVGIIELNDAPPGAPQPLSVTVSNVAPVITAASTNAGVIGNVAANGVVSVSAAFTDMGLLDTHTASINWGDGTAASAGSVSESGGSGTAAGTHKYASGGVYTATLTVTDDGGLSASRSVTVYVSGSGVVNGQLQIIGTAGRDTITVENLSDGSLSLTNNSKSSKIAAAQAAKITSVLVLLGAGDDVGTVVASNLVPVVMDGGPGNDTLKGGNGTNVLIGGEGNDVLIGGTGRDLLIGGVGADQLVGNAGDDILIAGTTAHDANYATLAAILADWAGSGTVAQRVARLSAGVGPGNAFALNPATVSDDASADVLTGSAGGDWFLFKKDGKNNANDLTTADVVLAL